MRQTPKKESPATLNGMEFNLIDTAGWENVHDETVSGKMKKQTESVIKTVDVAMLLFDAREGITPIDKKFANIIRKEKIQPKFVKYEYHDFVTISDSKNESSENQEKLYQAINKLSDIDKAIITLYLDEFSYKEIAKIMGISESNTGVKINRIKSLILKSLENGNK